MVAPSSLRTISSILIPVGLALASPTPRATAQACNPATTPNCTYDYIVVGGGTAGLTVAVRLSEDPKVTVAVVEAGSSGKGVDGIDIPALFGSTVLGPYDWNITTVPQTYSNNRQCIWPRGKVLGGSSALNFMVWDRASKAEYDAWEKLGNPGWNWSTIVNTIRSKVEHYHPPADAMAQEFGINIPASSQGTSGVIQTSIPAYVPDFLADFIPSYENIGVPRCDDPLNGDNVGASFNPSSIDPSTRARSYSASHYLWPNQGRANLAVISSATVTKVNLADANIPLLNLTKATGVNYVLNSNPGKTLTIGANKEVIVSAGSVQTPQILELSGIGNPDILNKFNIPTKINLPGVGENLQDHFLVGMLYALKDGIATPDLIRTNTTLAAQNFAAWHAGQPSMLDSSITGLAYPTIPQLVGQNASDQIVARAKTETQNAGRFAKQYNLQFGYLGSKVSQLETVLVNGYAGPANLAPPAGTFITLLPCLQHPFGRGSIHITTADPLALPAVDPQYFQKNFDLEVMVLAAKSIRKLASTPPFSNSIAAEVVPGPAVQTDEQWTEFVKNSVGTEFHPIGTASMLPKADGGVVDPTLRVYGTSNLRVVDASIIPLHISAHLQATTYAIAEIAVSIIKIAGLVGL